MRGGWLLLLAEAAWAGGLEFPGTGTEALGRGAAFTAKADDGTAVEYNVAGLARQRGTRLLFDGNLIFAQLEFQRAGTYPDDASNPVTPWGGKPFPKIQNQGGPFFAPFFALSTDFGVLDRWTAALALYGPSSVGNRVYPLGYDGQPSPSRYDFVQSQSLADGATATMAAGFLAHPAQWMAFGLHVRGPFTLWADGSVDSQAPRAAPAAAASGAAYLTTSFPWIVRAGVRFIHVRDGFERADLELDATYETWSTADPTIDIPRLGPFTNLHTTLAHHYHDTFSVRLGASYNVPIRAAVLSLRTGVFYDSSATDDADTRLDFDTLDKWAFTAGLGVAIHGVKLDLAYAYLADAERMVSGGRLTPTVPHAPTQPLPAVNDGRYHGRTHVVSIGVQIAWDELLGKPRVNAPAR